MDRRRLALLSFLRAFFTMWKGVGFLLSFCMLCAVPSLLMAKSPPSLPDRLLLEAHQVVYDKDNQTISAEKNVQMYYQGRVLQADRVIYYRESKRVYAKGRVKLTEVDGTTSYGDELELTDDFKDGFVKSLYIHSSDKTYFTAPFGMRIQGEIGVFEQGMYTACEPCWDNPEKPVTWQVKAKKIIHNRSEQTIYYEDARLEFLGVPVLYLPYFSSPDPTVKRKTGFLAPRYVVRSQLGAAVMTPFFWNIAPDYDLTLTPSFYTKQGLFGELEWRQKIWNGVYNLRAAGIYQTNPSVFSSFPYGPGNQQFRGSLSSMARFSIDPFWTLGWNVDVQTDRWFSQHYRLTGDDIHTWYPQLHPSTFYLNGQGNRGYFDGRLYHFSPETKYDLEPQQPIVAPVVNYNKVMDLTRTSSLRGELTIDANITHVSRELAAYQATGVREFDAAYHLYDICTTYTKSDCLLRGIGGDYTQATLQTSWKRGIIDPLGNVWTPFTFLRAHGAWTDPYLNAPPLTLTSTSGTSILANSSQSAFLAGAGHQAFYGQVMPGVGVEWRLPLMASSKMGTHVVEPIAQFIARPNENSSTTTLNEDAQSLVFDDTNLFEWSKFSGYDRFEGGGRLNYGAQYTFLGSKGGQFGAMAGQSYQIFGKNSYGTPDAANMGLSSGLDTRLSDYIGRVHFSPYSNVAFISKVRLDPSTFALHRFDVTGLVKFETIETSLQYARYEAQPNIGYTKRREGLSVNTKYYLNPQWFVTGGAIFDLSRRLYSTTPSLEAGPAAVFSLAGISVGGGYKDDCATISLKYASVYQDQGAGAKPTRNQTLIFDLQFRTIGDNIKQLETDP